MLLDVFYINGKKINGTATNSTCLTVSDAEVLKEKHFSFLNGMVVEEGFAFSLTFTTGNDDPTDDNSFTAIIDSLAERASKGLPSTFNWQGAGYTTDDIYMTGISSYEANDHHGAIKKITVDFFINENSTAA